MSIQLISGCSAQSQVNTLSFAVTQDEVKSWEPLIKQFEAKHKNIKIDFKIIEIIFFKMKSVKALSAAITLISFEKRFS